MLIRCGWMLPIVGPPVRHGAIQVVAGRIVSCGVGLRADDDEVVVDLSDAIVSPGLVNAHTHLDLSGIRPPLPARATFTEWLAQVPAPRPPWDTSAGLPAAVAELLQSGVTCVGDCPNDPAILPALQATPLRGVGFIEVIGASRERYESRRAAIAHTVAALSPSSRWQWRPSPHATYSLAPALLRDCLSATPSEQPLLVHCAESPDERQYFRHGDGPLAAYLAPFGYAPPTGGITPTAYLAQCGGLRRRLHLIHMNQLTDDDIALLGAARDVVTVTHCPPSYAHFGFSGFPLAALRAAGCTIALGTDSLASTSSLNFLEALAHCRATFPALTADEILTMATWNSARALGLETTCGSIEPGKTADLIAIRGAAMNTDPAEAVLSRRVVDWMMIDGEVVPVPQESPPLQKGG